MTVAELGVRMSAGELCRWQAFYAVEAQEREEQAKKDEADAKRRR